ncbi:MAG: STAS/SEC14 domain-containing protein [Myxococcota bacterium]
MRKAVVCSDERVFADEEGHHIVCVRAPHLIEVRWSGKITVGEALVAYLKYLSRLTLAAHGQVSQIHFLSQLEGYDAGVIRRHVSWSEKHASRVGGIAVVGASVVTMLAVATTSMLQSRPVRAFGSEADALAWVGAFHGVLH